LVWQLGLGNGGDDLGKMGMEKSKRRIP